MWPPNIGKRRFKSFVGCLTLPKGFIGHPGTNSGHPGIIPKTSQSSPNAVLGLKKLPRTIDEPAVTKQQRPASSYKQPETSDPHSRIQGRGPAAGGRRPSKKHIHIYIYIYDASAWTPNSVFYAGQKQQSEVYRGDIIGVTS